MTDKLISLLTSESDPVVTGGHMYNRHMIDAAPRHGFRIDVVAVSKPFDPDALQGVVVVDSLVAWKVALGILGAARSPMAALVHQVAGGVSGPRFLRHPRRLVDLSLYRKCQLVIAASPFLGRDVVSGGVSSDRIRVVPPGKDLPLATRIDRQPLARDGHRLEVLNVANWVPNKGILDLLDAIEPLFDDEVLVHLVGSPEMDPRFARRVGNRLSDPGLRRKVVVHGPVPKDQMGAFYRAADVVVLTSREEEGYGTVLAEALGSGVPVVAWSGGNVGDLFTDGEGGILLEAGDISGVTDALRQLTRDADFLSSLRAGAAQRGSELPTWRQSQRLFFEALDLLSP